MIHAKLLLLHTGNNDSCSSSYVCALTCVQDVRLLFFSLLLEANQLNRILGIRYVRERAYGDENVQVDADGTYDRSQGRATCGGAPEHARRRPGTVLVS
jgi:hypothetical protein